MYSRLVSLKPPFLALVRGVRTASVMTMSSAFLEVLLRNALESVLGALRGVQACKGGLHLVERAARRQVLENGTEPFDSHCCGVGAGVGWERTRMSCWWWSSQRSIDDAAFCNWQRLRYRRRRRRWIATAWWLPLKCGVRFAEASLGPRQ